MAAWCVFGYLLRHTTLVHASVRVCVRASARVRAVGLHACTHCTWHCEHAHTAQGVANMHTLHRAALQTCTHCTGRCEHAHTAQGVANMRIMRGVGAMMCGGRAYDV
eukprot:365188-Chlamydomonas_euryale.AAC.5